LYMAALLARITPTTTLVYGLNLFTSALDDHFAAGGLPGCQSFHFGHTVASAFYLGGGHLLS